MVVSFPEGVPVLTDGRVTLRAHRPADVEAVWEQCTDPVSQRWTTVPVPYSRADAERFVTEVIPAGWSAGGWAFAVEAPDDDGRPRFCGTVELRDEGNRRAEIAYGAHPWVRGRGDMVRALALLLDWGFTRQRLRTVIWWANTGNWASRRTASGSPNLSVAPYRLPGRSPTRSMPTAKSLKTRCNPCPRIALPSAPAC